MMYCDLRVLYVPNHTLKEYSQKTDSYESELDANVVPDGQQRLLSTATDVTLYIYISVVCRMCFSGCGIHPKPEAKKSRRHIPVPVADQHFHEIILPTRANSPALQSDP